MASLLYSLPLGSNWLQTDDAASTNTLNVRLKELKEDKSAVVLLGEERCGKTLLLFQAAVSYASQNHNVTFISRHPLSHIPLPVHGMVRPETAGQLETLTFLYMNTAKDLLQFCSGLHTKSILPDVLIVDDFQYYLSQLVEPSQEVGCALLCAQLVDVVSFIQAKGGAGVFMIGCNSKQTFLPSVFKQFNFELAHITKNSKEGTDYEMSVAMKTNKLTVTYNIQELGLFLNNITFHDKVKK